jgi:Flp pilus assembly protein TadG
MFRTLAYRRAANRRGATTVEFALTVPILFLLVFGAIEFSRAHMLQHTTEIAVTEAARQAIVPGATADECRDTCLNELAVLGISTATVEVDPTVITDDTEQVTVSVTIPVSEVNNMVLPAWFYENTLYKSVTMQREGHSNDPGEESVSTGAVFLQPDP